MLISVINESKIVSNSDVDLMCKAIDIQVKTQVLPAWNMKDASIQFCENKSQIPAHSWVVSVLDNSKEAGALGYHSLDNDLIDGFIFCEPVLSNGGVVLNDANNVNNPSVASVLSHEILEMIGDCFANGWSDFNRMSFAQELCDAVEGDSYRINVNGTDISVSNFVLPNFFDPQATSSDAPFDYLKKLTAPFSMTAGGYMIYRKCGPGSEQQVFGEMMPKWKKKLKKDKLKLKYPHNNWFRKLFG